jgi:hypothetical protein
MAGCAPFMAMHGEAEPDLGAVKPGVTRSEVELQLGAPVKSTSTNGIRHDVYEYQIGNEPSAGRAIGHATMVVLSLGLWEVIGTPIEGFTGEKYRMTVSYDELDRVTNMRTLKGGE